MNLLILWLDLLLCAQKLGLEAELREKDQQIYRITIKYNEVENELQSSKQDFFNQQQTAEQYINEVNVFNKFITMNLYVSFRLRVQNAGPAELCVGKY